MNIIFIQMCFFLINSLVIRLLTPPGTPLFSSSDANDPPPMASRSSSSVRSSATTAKASRVWVPIWKPLLGQGFRLDLDFSGLSSPLVWPCVPVVWNVHGVDLCNGWATVSPLFPLHWNPFFHIINILFWLLGPIWLWENRWRNK